MDSYSDCLQSNNTWQDLERKGILSVEAIVIYQSLLNYIAPFSSGLIHSHATHILKKPIIVTAFLCIAFDNFMKYIDLFGKHIHRHLPYFEVKFSGHLFFSLQIFVKDMFTKHTRGGLSYLNETFWSSLCIWSNDFYW